MLTELKFVQGSVARKDFKPELTHFHIKGGRVQGYNGMLSLSSPIALDLDITPSAVQLIKAVQGCSDTIAMSVTPAGRLAIRSGRFKAFVDCFPGGFPEINPEGERVELAEPILPALKMLAPCVAEDASRQWARGVLFRGRSMFATNNVVLVERFFEVAFPLEMNLPLEAVNELLRIGEEPTHLLVAANAVTFFFPGDRWMRAQLYTSVWPDMGRVLDCQSSPAPVPIRGEDLSNLLPFLDDGGRVHFLEGRLATSAVEGEGASVDVPDLPSGGIFNAHMLRLALERASHMDFTSYPAPCLFVGDRLRGALIGMRP